MNPRRPKDRLKSYKACASAGMNPGPVYIAHFIDGHVRRMSYWAQAGKPLTGERGQRLCVSVEPDRTFDHGEIELAGVVTPDGRAAS